MSVIANTVIAQFWIKLMEKQVIGFTCVQISADIGVMTPICMNTSFVLSQFLVHL